MRIMAHKASMPLPPNMTQNSPGKMSIPLNSRSNLKIPMISHLFEYIVNLRHDQNKTYISSYKCHRLHFHNRNNPTQQN